MLVLAFLLKYNDLLTAHLESKSAKNLSSQRNLYIHICYNTIKYNSILNIDGSKSKIMIMGKGYRMGRINDMNDTIRKAAAGNYTVRLETSGLNDELDLLTEAINHLLDQVQECHAACEQTKEALRESQERYRRLEENIPGMVYTYKFEAGEKHVFSYANEGSRELFGIEPEDLKRNDSLLAGLIHPDDIERRDASIIHSMETLQPWRQELRHIVNGEVRWYDCMSRPEKQPNGEILWSGIILEITDRKRAEEALRQEKRFSDDIINSLPGIFYMFDPQGKFFRWNKKFEEVTEYSTESINKLHPVGFFTGTDRKLIAGKIQEAIEAGPVDAEADLVTRTGVSIPHYFTGLQVELDGKPYILGLGLDITERKRAAGALRESEARFRQVVEFSPLPIGIINGDVPEYVNPKFVETFGYTLEDLPKLADWFRLAYPDPTYRQSVMERWETALREATAENRATEGLEVKVTCKDGSLRDVQIWSVLVGSKILAFCNDFTERKRMEEALEKRLVALSRPLDDAEEINFDDLFNLNDIQRIQDLLAETTGVASIIMTPDETPITKPGNFTRFCNVVRQSKLGLQKCKVSEAFLGRYNPEGITIHHCLSGGLWNAVASITVGGKHIMNWGVGQVRDGTVSEESLRDFARSIEVDEEELLAAYGEVPIMSQAQFERVAQALFVLANQLSSMAYQNVQQARFITERQRAEKELRESERKYRSLYQEFQAILNTIPDILCLLSPDLRIVWTNEGARIEEIDDVSEIIGQYCYTLRHERSQPCENCPVARCFQSGKLETEEGTAAGRIWELHAVPLYGEKGEVLGAVEVARDITERKEAEAALRESEARFRQLAEYSPFPIGIISEDAPEYLNPKFIETFGYTMQDLPDMETWARLAYPDPAYRQRVLERWQRALTEASEENRATEGMEVEVTCKDGTLRNIEIWGSLVGSKVLGFCLDLTERKQAEAKLRESEERLRLALMAANQGLYDLNVQTGEAQVTPEYATMLGYDPAEFQETNERWIARLHPDDRAGVSAIYRAYVNGEIPDYMVEFRQHTKSGDWKWILSLGKIVAWDEAGRPLRMLGTHTDITDRKRWEEELQKTTETLQVLVQASPTAIIAFDLDGIVQSWNQAAEHIFGWSAAEALGQFLPQIPKDKYEEHLTLRDKVLRGELTEFEVRRLRKDGSLVDLLVSTAPLKNTQGQVTGVISMQVDITERKRAEEELRESEKKYRSLYQEFQAILNANPDILCLISPDFRIVWANEIAAQAVGKDRVSEIIGQHCYPLRHEREEPCENCPVARCFQSGQLESQEVISFGRVWELYAIPLYGEKGELRGAVEVARDITERKRAEEKLRENEKKYRFLYQEFQASLNAIPDVVSLLSPDLRIVWTNEAARVVEIEGVSEVIGQYCYTLRHNRSQPCENCPVIRCFQSGKLETQEDPNKGRIWELRSIPLYGDKGELRGAVEVGRDITERKRSEEALRQSEAKYRRLHESMTDAFAIVDMSGRLMETNRAYQEMLGYSEEELRQMTYRDLTPEKWHAYEERIVTEQILRQGFSGVYEKEYRKKDGTLFLVEMRTFLLRDDAGQATGMWAIVRDITERKRAEEDLMLTQFAMDHSPDAAFWLRPDASFQYVNEEACRMLGYSREELLSLSIFDIDRDLTPEKWGPQWERSKQQRRVTLETYQRTKTGRIFPVEVRAAFVESAGQEFFCTFVRDITERKQAEEALEKRLVALSRPLDDAEDINFADLFNLKDIQRIQDLFAETTGVASLITTPDGTPITNPSNFCRLCREIIRPSELGAKKCMTSDATIGRCQSDGPIIQHCLSAGLCNAGASITVGGKHVANWLIGQVRDGTENEENMRDYARALGVDEEEFIEAFHEVPPMSVDRFKQVAQAFFVLANQLSSMAYQNVQQARFISERRQYDKEIKKLNLELEQRVAERTAQLKAANEELEAFAYSVSHDLRAPLRSIYGFSQALLEDYEKKLEAEGQDYLRRICNNIRYMDLLIENLLRLSRVTRAEMQSVPVNLSDIVRSLAKELMASQPERKVDFMVAQEVVVQADPALMRIALENLLHNAWKFTGGHEAAHIEFGTTHKDGEMVYFVKDDGAGFDMAYADKLFGVFQRLHDDLEFPGTGIGLATVQRIIHRHGGRIWAEGAAERGATFYFTLPVQ